jgi:hypothetical protein
MHQGSFDEELVPHPAKSSSVRKHLRWTAVLAAMLFFAGLFWLPYHVPVAPNVSDSYLFGYNNHVAELVIAIAAVLLGWHGPKLPPLQSSTPRPLSRSTLHKAMAVTLALGGVLFLLTRKLDGFEESVYLIDRIKLVLEGRVPYRDFEYAYGAAFLYGPAWMSRWFHLPVGDAYGIFWLLVSLAGTWMLYKTIEWIDHAGVNKRSLFLFWWTVSLPAMLNTGLNYSLLRFILPCFFALLVYRKMRPAVQPNSQAFALLLPVPLFLVELLVSPELALAFAVGVACYLAWFGHLKTGKNWLWFALMLGGFGALTWCAEKTGILGTMHAFSSGGMNFPLMPAAHVLLVLFCIGLAACYAGERLRKGESTSLCILIAVSALSLAAAFGRCDAGHALMNPLGVTLAASVIACGIPRLWRYFQPAMLVVFLLLPLPINLLITATLLRKAAQPTAQVHGSIDVAGTFGTPPETIFEVPFGFAPAGFGTYHSTALNEGYYLKDINMVTADSVARKVSELSLHPERPLLLMPDMENSCTIPTQSRLTTLHILFLYPYEARAVHPVSLTEPLCAYVRQNYHLQERGLNDHFGYSLWAPN